MNKDIAMTDEFFDEKQLQLIKESFGKGLSNDEFKMFLYVAQHSKLDPMLKQIYAVKYGGGPLSIITAIDGYRIVAERTGNYCPGKKAIYSYDKEGRLISATAFVKKLTSDGTWHEVEAEAFYSEYVQATKDGKPNRTWATRAHGQLAKCAEALALRKAFPNDLSGIRTEDEMGKVIDEGEAIVISKKEIEEKIAPSQVDELSMMLALCGSEFVKKFEEFVKVPLVDIPVSKYDVLHARVLKEYESVIAKNKTEEKIEGDMSFDPDTFEKEVG